MTVPNLDLFLQTHPVLSGLPSHPSILDVGTGCGVFALTQALAINRPIKRLVLSDYVVLCNAIALANFHLNSHLLPPIEELSAI